MNYYFIINLRKHERALLAHRVNWSMLPSKEKLNMCTVTGQRLCLEPGVRKYYDCRNFLN